MATVTFYEIETPACLSGRFAVIATSLTEPLYSWIMVDADEHE